MNRVHGTARIVITGAAGVLLALGVMSRSATAFNPQPDPPGFGLVSLIAGQGIRINVVCSEHGVGRFPPGPCMGSLMFHDMAGNTLASQDVRLTPGQAASLPLVLDRGTGSPVGIDPCWVPGPDNFGHAIPSAEVFSLETGGTLLFLNPAAARLSAFVDGSVRSAR
jgi:hypothetical protein